MAINREQEDQNTYRRRINAWAMYDWANSAFATTILASLLPIYYSTVAGATLPSEATATAYWSLTISPLALCHRDLVANLGHRPLMSCAIRSASCRSSLASVW